MKKTTTVFGVIAGMLAITLAGCTKDSKETVPVYDVPTTYNFTDVNYADAKTRIGMVTEMVNIMKNATKGPIDAQVLKDMFVNANARFTTAGYNASGIQIKDQTAPLFQTDALRFIDSLTAASKTGVAASRGVAGVGVSTANPATKYALSPIGINYQQIFSKTVMGGLICYQIANNYMAGGISSSVDNTTVVAGSGTALQHNWDLAFGYWGVPNDFPTNKVGAALWGSYSTQVDSGYHANKILMDAFLKGRAAIGAKDTKTIQAQGALIMQVFERIVGAAALQEVKEVKESISDNIVRNSRLSECYGFIYSLKYNPKKKITDAKIDEILALFPKNFYDLTLTQLNAIRDAVAAQYDFNDVKDIL